MRPTELQARFSDRAEAGRKLAAALSQYARREDVVVLALPRGGVPVAFEVARELEVPLDVFVVRKLGLPEQPELAMGAIASGGVRVLSDEVVGAAAVPPETIEEVAAREHEELARRESVYRGGRSALRVEGKTVILVDDGLATGSSMRAAVRALREQCGADRGRRPDRTAGDLRGATRRGRPGRVRLHTGTVRGNRGLVRALSAGVRRRDP